MSRKLPVLSDGPTSRSVVVVRGLDERVALARTCIAVCDAGSAGEALAFAAALREALEELGAEARVIDGSDMEAEHVVAAVDAAREALVIAVGNGLPGMAKPWLTVMLGAGLPAGAWTPGARALRDRIDLELADVRPGVARRLAAVASRAGAP